MMNLLPVAEHKVVHSSENQINDLADADLAAIFKRLPPSDRLIASEVCRRWHALSRQAWLDVKSLDLSSIPGQFINAISNQCPNLKFIFAFRKILCLNDLACLAKSSSLSTVKLYDCEFAIADTAGVLSDAHFAVALSDNLTQHAAWSELIVHDVLVSFGEWIFTSACLPSSLTRLQLSAVRLGRQDPVYCADLLVNALDGLQNLECFILHARPPSIFDVACLTDDLVSCTLRYRTGQLAEKLGALKRLKELCLAPFVTFTQRQLLRLIADLPQLAVLFLVDVDGGDIRQVLKQLITKHSGLRILVLSGAFRRTNGCPGPFDLPARSRFLNGFGSDPLPLLHVFVGKEASEKVRFAKSSSDAAIFHPIDQPMPQFLQREDVAPIFADVWVAEKIREAAKNGGGKLWNYELYGDASSVQVI